MPKRTEPDDQLAVSRSHHSGHTRLYRSMLALIHHLLHVAATLDLTENEGSYMSPQHANRFMRELLSADDEQIDAVTKAHRLQAIAFIARAALYTRAKQLATAASTSRCYSTPTFRRACLLTRAHIS
jgi:hypothetical protein